METAYTDAARRMADAVNIHIAVQGFAASGKWVACKLADGASDGALYDTKMQAMTHQTMDEKYYAYVMIPPTGMTYGQAERYLMFVRQCYDNGFKVRESDGDRTALLPSRNELHP
jgi:hypothetical protein